MRDLTTVRAELDANRQQMIEAGIRLGLLHPETIKLSQQVDELHNEYVRLECIKN
ncbi:aspartyl-phosphate phosphatase Spo0E family protein [Priestia megaterium]|uniref:aspartyl-phosphate phosphatase Spo0E family protein n=1 Tax=Priestia megaterium TaxID=1404 RepID=UPI0027954985|nr:aspartyl-phosphate phosphatase Spo0E family protein [Priestia megaterium]